MDEERLKKMVHLAMFEQGEGKKDIQISRYFRGDYIGLGLLKNVVLITIAYLIILGLVFVYHFDYFAANFVNMNLQILLVGLLICYLLVVGIFSVLVYVIRKLRYEEAARRMRRYHRKLLDLEKLYDEEERQDTRKGRTPS